MNNNENILEYVLPYYNVLLFNISSYYCMYNVTYIVKSRIKINYFKIQICTDLFYLNYKINAALHN